MLQESELRSLFPRADDDHVGAFMRRGDELFNRFGLSGSSIREQYFLAQIGHESGGLTITSENLNYSAERLCKVWPRRFSDPGAAAPYARNPSALANNVYANRMGNGPPESGDGWRYRGRGYIQITGRDGYEQVGNIAGLNLVAEPDSSAEPEIALLVACAFWEWKNLNAICDTGDFLKVTRRINGGTNGQADRRAWLDKVRRTMGVETADSLELEAGSIIELQRALQSAGFPEVGAADGILGNRSIAAIRRYRHENDLPEGLIDVQLLDALGVEF